MAPNFKPQEPKHPSDTLPFQDGRVTLHPIHLDTSSLYGQNRSKLYLPHSFRSLYSQEVPPICLKRDYLPIQNLSFGLNIPPFVFTKIQKHVDRKGHTRKRKHDNWPQLSSATIKSYNSAWYKWEHWFSQNHTDPLQPSLNNLLTFLVQFF